MAEIPAYLRTFDQEDRYDVDGDGNFREPDWFIDHFQIVHSGGDQAAGDPHQGSDAIWSHRSQAGFAVGPGGLIGFNAGSTRSLLRRRAAWTAPEQPDRALGRRLHDPARERRPRRVRARVRARPRPAGSLRHLREHRRRREQHRLLDVMSSGANIGDGGPTGSATTRSTWAPGRSSSSGGSAARRAQAGRSTTRSGRAARARSSSARPATARRPRARSPRPCS